MERAFTWLFVGVVALVVAAIVFVSLSKGVDATGLSIAAMLAIATVVFLLAGRSRRARAQMPGADATALPGWRRPSARDRRLFFVAAGAVFYSLTVVYWVAPQRSSGRYAWLLNAFYDALGPSGPAVLFAIVGTLLIGAAFAVRND